MAEYMDLTEFVDDGFLQEANRQFFHPLGLALTVMREDDGTVSSIIGVQDARDDEEGFLFNRWEGEGDGHTLADAERKRRIVEDVYADHLAERELLLGQAIQRVGQDAPPSPPVEEKP